MPGHKGMLPPPLDGVAPFDITEIYGADSLYEASGVIAETEQAYAKLYKTNASLLSAGGSTLCIQTMLALALKPGNRFICVRGAHVSLINTCALLDLEPVWIWPEIDPATRLPLAIDAAVLDRAFHENQDVRAVYITSPDYFGVLADIAAISAVCRKHGAPLLVDNAHGAHLKFLPSPSQGLSLLQGLSLHPIDLGADMCADSLHKTLPVLTGGALLHIRKPEFIPDAKRRMAMFGSTSPSYLIMLSCDMALSWLKNEATPAIKETCAEVSRLKTLAVERGFGIPSGNIDPMRLSLGFAQMGYSMEEFSAFVRENGVEPEYVSSGFCVFMTSPRNSYEDFSRLELIIKTLTRKAPIHPDGTEIPVPERIMSIREAVFAKAEIIPVDLSPGRIAASIVSPCPPGVPVAVPGEKITQFAAAAFKNSGASYINVVQ